MQQGRAKQPVVGGWQLFRGNCDSGGRQARHAACRKRPQAACGCRSTSLEKLLGRGFSHTKSAPTPELGVVDVTIFWLVILRYQVRYKVYHSLTCSFLVPTPSVEYKVYHLPRSEH